MVVITFSEYRILISSPAGVPVFHADAHRIQQLHRDLNVGIGLIFILFHRAQQDERHHFSGVPDSF